ncbi:hypothetical protein QFC22_005566 [Naganishia vaughanmartiniae]|uniref:Uncharacterized protein n=1 Tax=Naganishia vaughanmartiniae TaxID=1424756 RepID=A0ACC2WU54_9TREE|nr:hypothetical protein QFC22_005566 [Naganishia vaughanmartiniae]
MSFTLQSRTTLTNHPTLTRSVVHHARPARRPHYPSPLTPLVVKPTAGTSRPQPARKEPTTPASTTLTDSAQGLTFHYAPPPSAPSYTNGVVPDLLRWVQGAQVRVSEQAAAPLLGRKVQAKEEALKVIRSLSGDVVAEIQKQRSQDPVKWTRKALAKRYVPLPPSLNPPQRNPLITDRISPPSLHDNTSFQIPTDQTHHLARLAPAPKSHRATLAQRDQATRDGWTWRKRVARDAREVRKEFW